MRINNQKGNSLFLVMFLSGLSIYIFMDLVGLINNAGNRSSLSSSLDEADLFIENLITQVRYPNSCRTMFQNEEFDDSAPARIYGDYGIIRYRAPRNPKSVSARIATPEGPVTIRPGYELTPQLRIGSIRISEAKRPNNNPEVPMQPLRYDGRVYLRYLAELEVSFNQGGSGLKGFSRQLRFYVVTYNGRIQHCYGENSIGEFCGSWAGFFDPNLSEGDRCAPETYCRQGGSFQIGGNRNPLTNAYRCPSGYRTFQTNTNDETNLHVYECIKCD